MSKFHSLKVAEVRQETRDAIAVRFEVPEALRDSFVFKHGQYLTLRATVDGEDLRRSYSICSGVQDNELRVAIKRTTGGAFSSWANDSLQVGMEIEVMPPMGQFSVAIDPTSSRSYLGFAAGSGITPILSIAKTMLFAEPNSTFTLVYGNRSSSSMIFREELADLKDEYRDRLNLVYVMSREQQDIELFNGRINGQKVAQLLDGWLEVTDHDMAFICGPEDMMREVSETLQSRGMPKSAIKFELFAASAPTRARAVGSDRASQRRECAVTVIVDGTHRSFSMERETESLLDAGLKHGIDMRYSCKGGVCSTCRAKVVEGRVEMDVNFALEDYEIARGFVLTCQSFPVTDRVVIDFDQESH